MKDPRHKHPIDALIALTIAAARAESARSVSDVPLLEVVDW